MPFAETQVMDQRQRFVYDTHCSLLSFSEICRRYGISRKTGYKWAERWLNSGPEGLQDRTSRPCTSPLATPGHVVDAVLDVRRRHTDYGGEESHVVPAAESARAPAAVADDDPQHPAPTRSRSGTAPPCATLASRPANN
jgi:transposase-like protein